MTQVQAPTGDVITFQGYNWWAERGRIHCVDKHGGNYTSISVRDARERMKALHDMVISSKNGDPENLYHLDKIRDHQRFLEGMDRLCRKAEAQGTPEESIRTGEPPAWAKKVSPKIHPNPARQL